VHHVEAHGDGQLRAVVFGRVGVGEELTLGFSVALVALARPFSPFATAPRLAFAPWPALGALALPFRASAFGRLGALIPLGRMRNQARQARVPSVVMVIAALAYLPVVGGLLLLLSFGPRWLRPGMMTQVSVFALFAMVILTLWLLLRTRCPKCSGRLQAETQPTAIGIARTVADRCEVCGYRKRRKRPGR
jgi:hypothetical protein